MQKKLNDIIQNQSEFTIDSPNFSNEIVLDKLINGSNFYVVNLSVCEFQNCVIVYGDFLQCRFNDCTFDNLDLASSTFIDCDLESTNFLNLKFDLENPTLISNSKTSIRVTDSESFQEAIIY